MSLPSPLNPDVAKDAPPSTPPPSSPSCDISPRIHDARENFKDTIGYLADADIVGDFEWLSLGREVLLVTTETAAAYKAVKADPKNRGRKVAPPEPAVLKMIARISYSDCWLTPCGMWKAPTPAAQSFADVKLSCAAESVAEDPVLAADFAKVIENLNAIMQNGRTVGCDDWRGMLFSDESNNNKIKLRHKVFQDIRLSKAGRVIEEGMSPSPYISIGIHVSLEVSRILTPSPDGPSSTTKRGKQGMP